MSDLSSVIIWWLTIFIVGIIFLPITSILFSKFVDRGYIFAKIVGIIFSSYLIWLFGSFGILPFTKLTIIVVLLGWTLINLWIFKIDQRKDSFPIPSLGWIIFEESLFLFCLSFWSYVRATEPSIRGLEKFMDFGFVNSILRSNYFPPLDMWLTKSPDYSGGYFINYYYFGHYITAFLTKLSGIDSAITYNLMMATLFAFTFTLPFSIGTNLCYLYLKFKIQKSELSPRQSAGDPAAAGQLKIQNYKKRRAAEKFVSDEMQKSGEYALEDLPNIVKLKLILVGLLAAFLVALGGNLHTLYAFTSGYPNENPEPPWKLSFGFYPERYWYPNATRFIPFTIHEFPIYSFVVADIHGHVSDIPIVFLTIAFLLALTTGENGNRSSRMRERNGFGDSNQGVRNFWQEFEKHTSVSLAKIALLGMLLAIMYMTNAWDGIIYMLLSFLVILYRNLDVRRYEPDVSLFTSLYKTFSASLFLAFFFLLFGLPFFSNFKPFVSGIGVLCAPAALAGKNIGPFLFEAGKCQRSPWWMLAILWGFFYYNILGFLLFIIIPKIRSADYSVLSKISEKFKRIFTSVQELSPVDIFILLIIIISTFLLTFPEFFYIKDIYPAHYRANTMFKLGYQAFMMLGIASAYIFIRIRQEGRRSLKFFIFNFLFFILFFLVAIYPYFAINSYYGGLQVYRGLYGLNWLSSQFPDDYQAILWLRKNIQCDNAIMQQCNNQPVIVEASGDSYTDYARVSANTGLPTIVGWPVHEWLWRGSYDEAGRRIPEVATIYESKDINQTKEIIRKYKVEYIFLGTLEKEKYKNLDEEKLKNLGKVVFESGNTKIYRITSL